MAIDIQEFGSEKASILKLREENRASALKLQKAQVGVQAIQSGSSLLGTKTVVIIVVAAILLGIGGGNIITSIFENVPMAILVGGVLAFLVLK